MRAHTRAGAGKTGRPGSSGACRGQAAHEPSHAADAQFRALLLKQGRSCGRRTPTHERELATTREPHGSQCRPECQQVKDPRGDRRCGRHRLTASSTLSRRQFHGFWQADQAQTRCTFVLFPVAWCGDVNIPTRRHERIDRATGLTVKALILVGGCSSDGRALQSHCRGQGFDSPQLHQGIRGGISFAAAGRADGSFSIARHSAQYIAKLYFPMPESARQ